MPDNNTSDRKPAKTKILWPESLLEAFGHIMVVMFGRLTVIVILSQILNFTSVLWAPRQVYFWLASILLPTGSYIPDLEPFANHDPASQCLTHEEKKYAVQASPTSVSGWYGPGAYLAWLFTAYISSISSIRFANKHDEAHEAQEGGKGDGRGIEGELAAAVMYPAIAILDILYRLITCKVDPSLDAAMLVVFSSVITLGISRRLCSTTDCESLMGGEDLIPSGWRRWSLSVFLVLCHCLIFATTGEPYSDWKLLVTVYVLALFCIGYSSIRTETLMEKYPYLLEEMRWRPVERIVVFCLIQAIYLIVAGATRGTIFPRTGSRLSDLDQCATLVTIVLATILAKRKQISTWVQRKRAEFAGFQQVQSRPMDV